MPFSALRRPLCVLVLLLVSLVPGSPAAQVDSAPVRVDEGSPAGPSEPRRVRPAPLRNRVSVPAEEPSEPPAVAPGSADVSPDTSEPTPFRPPPLHRPSKLTPPTDEAPTDAAGLTFTAPSPSTVKEVDAGTQARPATLGTTPAAVPTADLPSAFVGNSPPGNAGPEKKHVAIDAKRVPPKPLETPKVGDAEVSAAIAQWRMAAAHQDRAGQEKAEHDLLQLREDLGITELDAFSAALLRAAHSKAEGERVVALTSTATELSPGLSPAHISLARVYLFDEPLGVARWAAELKDWATQLWTLPRYRRSLIGNLGAASLFSWVATAVALMVVLTLRRMRSPMHDLHHALFPSAVAPWQSAVLLSVVLFLPIIFRWGLAPQLLVLFVVCSAYLSWRERVLATLLLGTLGLFPLAVREWVRRSAFEGTPAADVYVLEQGGLSAQPLAAHLLKRMESSELDFAELFALGRYEQRRGKLDLATAHFKQAALVRPGDARLLTNLGNTLLAGGDSEGAANLYAAASQADGTLAAPYFNAARLYQRRIPLVREEAVVSETEKALTALDTAQRLDANLLTRPEPSADNMLANRQLLAVPLDPSELEHLIASDDLAERVSAQLSAGLVGTSSREITLGYPAALALLALLLGGMRRLFRVSHACEKCGRAVCVRCDPELDGDSPICNQCVHAFGRKGALSAAETVRKQIEVRRYQSRHEKFSYALALVVSGAGHLFNGETLKGAAYAFLWLFIGFIAYMPQGVLRSAYVWFPPLWTLIPAGVFFACLYALSLRGLYRRLNA